MSNVRTYTDQQILTMLDRLYLKNNRLPSYESIRKAGYVGGTTALRKIREKWRIEKGLAEYELAIVREVWTTRTDGSPDTNGIERRVPRPEPKKPKNLGGFRQAIREHREAERRLGISHGEKFFRSPIDSTTG